MGLVIAIDPGKMTGYWCYRTADLRNSGLGGQLPQWDFIDWLVETMKLWENNGEAVDIACESFTITQRSMTQRGDRLWSVEQIGIIQHLVREHNKEHLGSAAQYIEQSPSDAKTFADNDKLRRVGWYQVGMEHARDAARHALLYATRRGHIDPAVLLKGWDDGGS